MWGLRQGDRTCRESDSPQSLGAADLLCRVRAELGLSADRPHRGGSRERFEIAGGQSELRIYALRARSGLAPPGAPGRGCHRGASAARAGTKFFDRYPAEDTFRGRAGNAGKYRVAALAGDSCLTPKPTPVNPSLSFHHSVKLTV